MTKVDEKNKPDKKFIPGQVGTHNKAIDILCSLQKVQGKISEFKKQIANVDSDISVMGDCFSALQWDIRSDMVKLHDWQVLVYRRILAHYLNHIAQLYNPAMYHDIAFNSQPNALKNVPVAQ